MEFDCRKVFGAENADAIKKGDKVYAANDFAILKDLVNNEGNPDTIKCIRDTANFRFQTEDNNYYAFAYLVERAAENWRPYKDVNELITAWQKKTGITARPNTMPLIWVKYKNPPNEVVNITGVDNLNNEIYLIDLWKSLRTLFDNFTFLDGTPCGIKECE